MSATCLRILESPPYSPPSPISPHRPRSPNPRTTARLPRCGSPGSAPGEPPRDRCQDGPLLLCSCGSPPVRGPARGYPAAHPVPTGHPSSRGLAAPVGCAQVTVLVQGLGRENGSDRAIQALALGSSPSSLLHPADGVRGPGLHPWTATPCPVHPMSYTGGCHTLLSPNSVNSSLELLLELNWLPGRPYPLVTRPVLHLIPEAF